MGAPSNRNPAREFVVGPRLFFLEATKAIALIGIFLNHVSEEIFGYPFMANPGAGWPLLSERLAQLAPIDGYGLLSIPLNGLRYLGWLGEQGVMLFLVASGFGLTWGLLQYDAGGQLSAKTFFARRARRVYPLWWGAHIGLAVVVFILPWYHDRIDLRFLLSFVGIRFTEGTLYYLVPAWWFIGLLLQLYLVYPLLWRALQRYGPLWLLFGSCLLALPIRAAGLLFFDGYLDAWSRGAIFITRLPEFVLGMSVAALLIRSPSATDGRLRSPAALAGALFVYLSGNVLSLTLAGMTIAPLLMSTGLFLLVYALSGGLDSTAKGGMGRAWLSWIGSHSYSLYLVHQVPILVLLAPNSPASSQRNLVGIPLSLAMTVVAAVALEKLVDRASTGASGWRGRGGAISALWRPAVCAALVAMVAFTAELVVQRFSPQEVNGWGERPSLEAHADFGWRLRPSRESRLRWESYDYKVVSNSLGFPGPDYPPVKPAGTLRIMTIGDAYTSAEGVNTEQAWPRLLEHYLAEDLPDRDVQVLNFAITGYGPGQYTTVLREYVPEYQPDLIVIGFFVNDYSDVLMSNEEFQSSIGFSSPPQDTFAVLLKLSHLRQLANLRLYEPVRELISGEPRPHGYFLGQFGALERSPAGLDLARERIAEQFELISEVAATHGSRVLLAMVPAPVQVCESQDLDYYPRHVDLEDRSAFDLDQPQRDTRALADRAGFEFHDLRPVLTTDASSCPYHSSNMHWTAEGHEIVARYLASRIESQLTAVTR